MFNMQKLMKEAQKAKENMEAAQERIAGMHVEGSAGGGMVTVSANGMGEIASISLDPSTVNPDSIDLLEDLIVAAVNDVQSKAKELQQKELGSALGGMGGMGGMGNMAGLGNLFGN